MTFQLDLHTATLLFFLSFNVFATIHNCSAKISDCWRVVSCDSGPESGSANFTDSTPVNSPSRQNGRLRPTATLASTPTPHPCLSCRRTLPIVALLSIVPSNIALHCTLYWRSSCSNCDVPSYHLPLRFFHFTRRCMHSQEDRDLPNTYIQLRFK